MKLLCSHPLPEDNEMNINDKERYKRQLLLDEISEAGQQRLSEASVLIIGLGGLGAIVAAYLAGAGVGRIGLMDFDVVELNNLHRQVFYNTTDLGSPKVRAMAQHLVKLNPELKYDMKRVNEYLKNRVKSGKPYSIVVVAEGIKKPKKVSAATYIAEKIEEGVGVETRKTILGYIQRGGSPSPMDRLLASSYGAYAVDLIAREDYGKMVMKDGETISDLPLSEVGGKLRLVPTNHSLLKKAYGLGVCLGNEPG